MIDINKAVTNSLFSPQSILSSGIIPERYRLIYSIKYEFVRRRWLTKNQKLPFSSMQCLADLAKDFCLTEGTVFTYFYGNKDVKIPVYWKVDYSFDGIFSATYYHINQFIPETKLASVETSQKIIALFGKPETINEIFILKSGGEQRLFEINGNVMSKQLSELLFFELRLNYSTILY